MAPACLSHAEGGTGESELAMSSVGRARGRMLIASDEEHSELRVASLAKDRITFDVLGSSTQELYELRAEEFVKERF